MAIKCPKCQADNPDTKQFCGDCGTQLVHPKDIPEVTKTLETPFPQFAPGTSLANRYEIIKELARGGMGEVYLAEDTNLKRQVAIKVLPKTFSMDEERLARFEREARLLASLNHPNVATIYGLEKSDDHQFLVMELVEGDTLAERIKKGSFPVDETLEVCKQIAEGLESAHEKGIIHRDLKPNNIKITPKGKVKILDFGLAKAYQEESEEIDLSKSPTLTDQMTQPGVILGTAAYMSPEQARSRPVDKRTDIWAFGCVLYECLTGKLAFQGETFSDTLAHILKGEPDWTRLPSNTPVAIKVLLRRCLQKDPSNRLRDIGDARIDIDEAHISPEQAVEFPIPRPITKRWSLTWASAALIIGIFIGFIIMHFIQPTQTSESLRRVSINLPRPMAFIGSAPLQLAHPSLAISRNGTHLVYAADIDGETQLYLRAFDQIEAIPIKGTEGAYNPFFSPDSKWIGFFTGNEMKKVSISGGEPIFLCEVSNTRGASWGSDNTIVFSQNEGSTLYMISASGKGLLKIAEKGRYEYEWPEILPGGKAVLVSSNFPSFTKIVLLDTREEKILLERGSNPKYVSTGHIIYTLDGRLQAVPFDVGKLEVNGIPITIIDNIRIEFLLASQCVVSDNGTLVYAAGGPANVGRLVWVDRHGKVEELPFPAEAFGNFHFSPDGKRLAIAVSKGGRFDIWIYDLIRKFTTRVTQVGNNYSPIWTPDGKSVIFTSDRAGAYNLFIKSPDASEEASQLTRSTVDLLPSSRSGNDIIAINVQNPSEDIYLHAPGNKDELMPFASTRFDEWGAAFSPDGRFIAYTSSDQGPFHVYVEPYPQTGERWQISTEGGSEEPVWSPNTDELFYRNGRKWMAVTYQLTPVFSAASPQVLFEGDYINVSWRSHDISPDGKRFLLIKPIEEATTTTQLNVVFNWFEELKQKVPAGK